MDGTLAVRLGWMVPLIILRRLFVEGPCRMMVARRLARMNGYILSYETSGWRMRDEETCIEENIIELRGRDKARRPKKRTRRVRKLEHGIDK